ncbi:hypothetical protein VTH06DRAFT_1362 [Thermothelomyces fergusii]
MPQLPRENARLWFFLFLVLVTLMSRNDAPSLIAAPFFGAPRLGRLWAAHGILNSTEWGDFSPGAAEDSGAPPGEAPRYLNLTGFRETDGYAWGDLAYFRDRCRQWSRHAYPPPKGAGEWEHGPVRKTWQNATGTVQGKWVRRPGSVTKHAGSYNLSAIAPGVHWLDDDDGDAWAWNVTGSHGTILLRLSEDANDAVYEEEEEEEGEGEGEAEEGDDKRPSSGRLARPISVEATVQDEDHSATSFAMKLYGVHWPRQGSILLTTTTEKFAGIFGLPHLVPSREFYRSGRGLLNRTVGEVLSRKEQSTFADASNPWTPVVEEEVSVPVPRCEYVMYLQLHQLDARFIGKDGVDDKLVPLIDQMERELRFPTGAPLRGKAELRMSLVAWSPDCGYYLESKGPPLFPSVEGNHLVGLKSEVLLSRTKSLMFAFAAVLMAQLWLLKAQMRESNTPSTLARISFHTVAVMLLADGLIFACSTTWSLSASNTFLPSLILTFAAFMSMTLGAGFLSEIYKHQEPERRREQARAAADAANPRTTPAASAPTTATAPASGAPPAAGTATAPPSPPIIIPSDQDIDAEIAEHTARRGAAALPAPATATATAAGPLRAPHVGSFASMTGIFVLVGIAILLLIAMSLSWPPRARSLFFHVLSFAYLSFWIPQIRRNAWRNSRRAFSWRFVVGQSVLRLAPFAYFYLRKDNVLFVETDATAFLALAGWLWCQLVVMAAQDVLGPRAGLPKSWMPEVWEYHPVLRESDVEGGGLPIGLVASLSSPHGGEEGDGSGSTTGSPVVARSRGWSVGSSSGEAGAQRRERAKELERHGMMLREIDCAICTEVLEVPVVRANAKDPSAAGGLAGVFARRAYMVTPCRHIFHTKCLEGWFRYKLQCPICREELPPL